MRKKRHKEAFYCKWSDPPEFRPANSAYILQQWLAKCRLFTRKISKNYTTDCRSVLLHGRTRFKRWWLYLCVRLGCLRGRNSSFFVRIWLGIWSSTKKGEWADALAVWIGDWSIPAHVISIELNSCSHWLNFLLLSREMFIQCLFLHAHSGCHQIPSQKRAI